MLSFCNLAKYLNIKAFNVKFFASNINPPFEKEGEKKGSEELKESNLRQDPLSRDKEKELEKPIGEESQSHGKSGEEQIKDKEEKEQEKGFVDKAKETLKDTGRKAAEKAKQAAEALGLKSKKEEE